MTTTPDDIIEPERPGRFERIGIDYIKYLAGRDGGSDDDYAADDTTLARRVRRVTWAGAAVAFLIGALSAGGAVYTEIYFDHEPWYIKYSYVGIATALCTAVEFFVLFWVSLRTVYAIGRITGHTRAHLALLGSAQSGDVLSPDAHFALLGSAQSGAEDFGFEIPNLLARAALEIPDPVRRVLGIDPLARVSKRRLFVVGLLYKAKIVGTNVLAKLFLRRFFGKALTRAGILAVSVPITGLWNAVTIWKVARDARLRLFGNLLSYMIVREEFTPEKLERLSPAAREGCLRAVGNSVVLTQNHHPNMLILFVRLCRLFEVKDEARFDDWSLFLESLRTVSRQERYFLMDLLAVATAFDGKLSPLERQHLPEAFGEHTEVYLERIQKLQRHLRAGRLHAARELCRLDFTAG